MPTQHGLAVLWWTQQVPRQFHQHGTNIFHALEQPENATPVAHLAIALATLPEPGRGLPALNGLTWVQGLDLAVAATNAEILPASQHGVPTTELVQTIHRRVFAVSPRRQGAAWATVRHLGGTDPLGLPHWYADALRDETTDPGIDIVKTVARACQAATPAAEWRFTYTLGWISYLLDDRPSPDPSRRPIRVVLDVTVATATDHDHHPPELRPDGIPPAIRDRVRRLPRLTPGADVTLVDSTLLHSGDGWLTTRVTLDVTLDTEHWQARWGVAAADALGGYLAADLTTDPTLRHHDATIVCRR